MAVTRPSYALQNTWCTFSRVCSFTTLGANMETKINPYKDSLLVQRLRCCSRVSVLDLDNTWTGSEASQIQMHEIAHGNGAVVYNTARETGMVMSSEALQASRKYGYTRAAPHLVIDPETGRYVYAKPERVRRLAGLLDPSAIVGFGGGVLLRQPDRGYAYDDEFSGLLGRKDFRKIVRRRFEEIDFNGDLLGVLSELEDDTAFGEGRTDVQPLDWRFQFNPRDDQHKVDLKLRIASHFLEMGERGLIDFRDESKPGKPCFYVIPSSGTKEASADHLLRRALAEAGVRPEDVSLTIADDALTGLCMLKDVLPEAPAIFVLPGGAPVARHLMASSSLYGTSFAGEDISWLLKRLTPIDATPGKYVFKMPGDLPDRTFYIADEAVEGRESVDSLLALEARGDIYPT